MSLFRRENGTSMAFENGLSGAIAVVNGKTTFCPMTLFFLSVQTIRKGKKTNQECIDNFTGLVNSKRRFRVFLVRNIRPVIFPRIDTLCTGKLIFLLFFEIVMSIIISKMGRAFSQEPYVQCRIFSYQETFHALSLHSGRIQNRAV